MPLTTFVEIRTYIEQIPVEHHFSETQILEIVACLNSNPQKKTIFFNY